MVRQYIRFVFFALTLLWSLQSWANVPQLLTYKGYITDAKNKPVAGTVEITFRLYDGKTGGKVLWTEKQSVVTSQGHFTVVLGASTALNMASFRVATLYLGIKIGKDPEMIPRTRVTSVPYALIAKELVPKAVLNVSSLKVNGKTVIDSTGKWTGTGGGTAGPKGPKGDPGPKGPKGDPGAVKTFTCPTGQFLRGIDSKGAALCAKAGTTGTQNFSKISGSYVLPTGFLNKGIQALIAYDDNRLSAVLHDTTSRRILIYNTANRGKSWTLSLQLTNTNIGAPSTSFSISRVSKSSFNSFVLMWYSSSKIGLIRVYNYGVSYRRTVGAQDANQGHSLACTGQNLCSYYRVYRTTNYYYYLYSSADGGNSWSQRIAQTNSNLRNYGSIAWTGTVFLITIRVYNTSTRKYDYNTYRSTNSITWTKVITTDYGGLQSYQGNIIYMSRHHSLNGGSSWKTGSSSLFNRIPSASNCSLLLTRKEIICSNCEYTVQPGVILPYKCLTRPRYLPSRWDAAPSGKYFFGIDNSFFYIYNR